MGPYELGDGVKRRDSRRRFLRLKAAFCAMMKFKGDWPSLAGPVLSIGLIALVAGASMALNHAHKARDSVELHETAALNTASHAMQTMLYAMTSNLNYDDSTEAGRNAPVFFRDALLTVNQNFDAAIRFSIDDRPAIADLKGRFELLSPKAGEAFLTGNALPGLTAGASLDPEQLAELAAASKATADVVVQLHGLAEETQSLSLQTLKRHADEAEQTPDRTDIWLIAVGVAGLAGLGVGRLRPRQCPPEDVGAGGKTLNGFSASLD